jgi:hypothetical protein
MTLRSWLLGLVRMTGRGGDHPSMFCCQGFASLVGNAGREGVAALVQEVRGEFKFVLQFRAVSKTEEERISRLPAPLPLNENLKTSLYTGLNFCPYCGTRLASLVTVATRTNFQALADKHKIFGSFYF